MAERVPHTLYQVSTATALVEGIYQGAVQVAALREHGDLGLGTFESLDGEMVVVDGHFFQVRSDGSVREVPDNVLSPFAADDHGAAASSADCRTMIFIGCA
jgi:acetolactate decarboxylase